MKDQNKKKLMLGVGLVAISFVCILLSIYMIISIHREKVLENDLLKENLGVVETEKSLAERKVAELEKEVGTSLYLDKLLNQADKVYGENEAARKEGYLWIDRNEKLFVATLGALNGLTIGSRLAVYDGGERVGYVRVETPFDVISYVYPINMSMNQFASDYYRVVIEE